MTSRDTLYLVAADARTSPVPPLFVAILAEIAHTARHLGSFPRPARRPAGRRSARPGWPPASTSCSRQGLSPGWTRR